MKMYAKKVAANEDKRKKAMVEEEDDGGTFASDDYQTIKTVNKTEYVATKTMEDTSDDAKFLNDLFSNFLVVLIFLDILRRENDDEDEDGGAIDERNIIGEVKLAQRAAACYLASNTLTSITHITVPLCP
ncbi:hypothetical protein M378DRAFT_16281 [Amanita muscaria Koide BX008]|uniref:Uncharacterized protein n=1 Tax=Amanita muscaria (strain Koide BX008) TaxID=946122 RepID=A0A0C2S401_AMAMK|nr:hypothetical protein M378DRAFT_16281 [Amanita muscaria Koide BX008]